MASFKKRRPWTAAAFSLLLAVVLLRGFCCRPQLSNLESAPGGALEGHRFPVQALVFASDNSTLTSVAGLMGSLQGEVELIVWDAETRRPGPTYTKSLGERRMLAVAPDARTLVTAGPDQTVRLWETHPLREAVRLGEGLPRTSALVLSGDGRQLATADHENQVRVWDTTLGQLKVQCNGPTDLWGSLAFAPDGAVLAGGGFDRTVRLWDVATGEEMAVLPGHVRPVMALAFSPDGRLLASGDLSGVVKVWDVATRTGRATLLASEERDFAEEAAATVFAPDGRTLAVAVGRAVQLWDVATGKRLASREGHEGKVICLVFAPDGTRLASGGYDTTVRLWDVAEYRSAPR